MRNDLGRENTIYVHVTWLPHIGATGELKTKPTQHSVRELRSIGISPDVIVARADYPIEQDLCAKIALFCDVPEEAVIPVTTTKVTYEVPLLLEDRDLGHYLVERLQLQDRCHDVDWSDWQVMIEAVRQPGKPVRVAIVGKYIELEDAYISVKEALWHAGLARGREVEIVWVDSTELETNGCAERLQECHGIVVPGGFGERGIEGKVLAAKWARRQRVPYLGLCLGMQVMCIELGRAVLDSDDVNSTEFNSETEHPVISLMPDQRDISEMGGTMRLGVYPCVLVPGTRASAAYGIANGAPISERHRHRFEFNNDYREILAENGMVFSGLSPDDRLVEIAEIEDHPFMLGSQFHPEFLSRPNRPHPLFAAFMAAAAEHAAAIKNTTESASSSR
jgi:CTP synthase